MPKLKALFISVQNSSRSQIAEAYLNHYGKDLFIAESAGLVKGTLNPVVIEVMREEGIDISKSKTQTVAEVQRYGNEFNYVVFIGDKDTFSKCPALYGKPKILTWNFNDPQKHIGTYEENKAVARNIRNQIKSTIQNWLKEVREEELV